MPDAMLCPVCGTTNHHLAVVCSSCGSFVQGRIENLDLFSTMWAILERPLRTFHTIAIARHKNYALFLSALAGIALTFIAFWIGRVGNYAESLINLLAAGLLVGPFVGVFIIIFIAAILTALGSVVRLRIGFRNAFAVSSYAFVPIALSAIIVLPIELMTFGIYFFTSNPSPYLLKPTSYSILFGLNTIFSIWSIVLLIAGIRVLVNRGWVRSMLLALLPLALCVGVIGGAARIIMQGSL